MSYGELENVSYEKRWKRGKDWRKENEGLLRAGSVGSRWKRETE